MARVVGGLLHSLSCSLHSVLLSNFFLREETSSCLAKGVSKEVVHSSILSMPDLNEVHLGGILLDMKPVFTCWISIHVLTFKD